MKNLLLSLITLSSISTFAAGTLNCSSEDGSELHAIINNETGSVPTQFKMKVRDGKLVSYPDATASYYESSKNFINGEGEEEKIKLLVVSNAAKGIIAVIKDGDILIDRTGTYSAKCEFGY
jgi:hypothetical protein